MIGLYYVGYGICYAAKAYVVVKTAQDIHEVAYDEELTATDKAHRIATDVAFIGMQTLDFGIAGHFFGPISESAEILSRIGTGMSDVAVVVSKKVVQDDIDTQDLLDIGAEFAFRTADTTALASHFPDMGSSIEFKETTGALSAGAILIAGRDKISSAFQKIRGLGRTTNESTLSEKEKYILELEELKTAQTIFDWSKIPPSFQKDNVFTKWKCPLSGNPIRFIVVIQKTKNLVKPVFYEKAAIEEYLMQNPRKLPPEWPKKISIRLRKLENYDAVQRIIDGRLNVLLRQIKECVEKGEFDLCYPENLT